MCIRDRDLEDIRNAHVLLCFTDECSTTGGFHVEFGYALANGLRPIVVGPCSNIFMALPGVVHFTRFSDDVVHYLNLMRPTAHNLQH